MATAGHRRGHWILAAASLLAIALPLTGCGALSDDQQGQGKANTVKIGISPIAIYAAGYQIKDRLAKEGITVKFAEFSATPDRLAALVNGSIDMAFEMVPTHGREPISSSQ